MQQAYIAMWNCAPPPLPHSMLRPSDTTINISFYLQRFHITSQQWENVLTQAYSGVLNECAQKFCFISVTDKYIDCNDRRITRLSLIPICRLCYIKEYSRFFLNKTEAGLLFQPCNKCTLTVKLIALLYEFCSSNLAVMWPWGMLLYLRDMGEIQSSRW